MNLTIEEQYQRGYFNLKLLRNHMDRCWTWNFTALSNSCSKWLQKNELIYDTLIELSLSYVSQIDLCFWSKGTTDKLWKKARASTRRWPARTEVETISWCKKLFEGTRISLSELPKKSNQQASLHFNLIIHQLKHYHRQISYKINKRRWGGTCR